VGQPNGSPEAGDEMKLRFQDVMNPDLLSEILLLGSSTGILVALLLVVGIVLTGS
jgi:hypothetical protein